MLAEINYGKTTFRIEVSFLARKQISITVHPDLRITAKAPLGTDTATLENRLQKRASWIAQKLSYFEKYHPQTPPRQYINGETHRYLGRQYRLRIQYDKRQKVRLIGRYFNVETPRPNDRKHIRQLMHNWYLKHAKRFISKRLNEWWPVLKNWNISQPEIKFRRMQKRWGSLTPSGAILFNTELVKAPIHCVDYVIVHELCHLIYPRHENRYYRLLERIMPDWENRKERLERVNIR